MYRKFDFIRRLANEATQIARLVAFDLELDVDISEEEVIEELEFRGYRIHASH